MSAGEQPANLTGTVLRGAGLAAGGFFLAQALTLAFYVALARLITPRDFGVFVAGSVVVSVGSFFAESGMLAALIHRRDRLEEAASTAVIATISGGLLLSLLALALAPVIGWFFDSESITAVAAALSGLVLLRSATVVPDALLQRRFSFLRRVVVEPLGILVFGITAVVLCSRDFGAWGLVIGRYAGAAVAIAAAWGLARWLPRLRLASFAMWRELARYGRHVVASEFIQYVATETSTLLLGRFAGVPAVGQYQYAYRIGSQPYGALVSAASYVLLPAFARISGEVPRLEAAVLRSLRWMCLLAIPGGLIFLPTGQSLVAVVFGDRWEPAGDALVALCGFTGARAIVAIAVETFKATGRPELLTGMQATSAALTIGLMAALVPFGVVGVAAAVSLSSVLVAAYALRGIGMVVGIPVRTLLGVIWPPLLAASVMAVVVYPLDHFVFEPAQRSLALGAVLLGAELLAAAAVYVIVVACVAPDAARELLAGLRSRRAVGPP